MFFVLALHAAYDVYKQELVDEEFVLKEFFAIGLFAYAHLVVSLIWEVTGILRIKCFSIRSSHRRLDRRRRSAS